MRAKHRHAHGAILAALMLLGACSKDSESSKGELGTEVEVADAGAKDSKSKDAPKAESSQKKDETSARQSSSKGDAGADAQASKSDAAEKSASEKAQEKPAKTEDKTLVRIPFLATVNEEPLKCGTRYANVGTSRSSIQLSDFRFYVHDVALLDASGKATPVQLDEGVEFQQRYKRADGSEGGLALLDFATLGSDACSRRGTDSTNTVISGHAPEGKYTRLTFTLGVPPELNHLNGSVSKAPLNSYGMQWSWASGYRYMKLEVEPTTGDKTKEVYYFHPGAAGCTSDNGAISGKYKCDNDMTSRIELPYTPGSQAVQADLGRLLATSDLSTGRGCMGTSSLTDPDGDGPDVQPKTGCAEIWATLGLKLGKVFANASEKLGTCAGATTMCKTDGECGAGASCMGYVAAKKAEKPESGPQTTFVSVGYDSKLTPTIGARPPVDELQDDMPLGWPHPDYKRDAAKLDVPALSLRGGKDSHDPQDPRYGSNCGTCHQELGPGKGRYAVSGTIYAPKGGVYTGGGVVQLGTGIANRNGPWTHPVADKIMSFEPVFEIPIDAYGQFYATADQAEGLDYAKRNYFARIVGATGACKSRTGQVVMNASNAAVSCKADADCKDLRYTQAGQCIAADGKTMMESGHPRSCATAEECGAEGASCTGAGSDQVPVCDKLLNAMPLEAVGSCNFCHGDGFRIYTEPTL